jgi:uncharacterized membrane protein
MQILAYLIPDYLSLMAGSLLLVALLVALYLAPWRALRLDPGRVHLVAGGAVACLMLWLINIRTVDGLILHLLGMTTLTLVVGWSLSIIAASLSLLVMNLLLGLDLGGYPVSWFFTVLLPASVSSTLASLLHRPRLKNPFFYMLGAGFAGGGLVVMLIALLAEALFALTGLGGLLEAISEYWPLLLLMMFSEAFINGMLVSALAIFFPDWLKTFDDHFYLDDA